VLSVSVSQRAAEFGLRKALGADSREVLTSVMRESMAMAAIGGGIGIAAAVILSRSMESLLFGVSGSDPLTLLAVAGLIGLTAVVAALVPALKASRTDPMVALKGQ